MKKAYREVLESIDIRIAAVREFLELFKRAVEYDIVPITDVYGPTASDPNIQVLIVSRETVSGANASEFIQISYETQRVHPAASRVHVDADLLFDLYMALGEVLTPDSFVVYSYFSKGGKVVAGLENIRY